MKKGEHLFAFVFNTNTFVFLSLCLTYFFINAGWKNVQLAQQLEERERRIKNHLDLAAKGQSKLQRRMSNFAFALTI